jgi:hypothetical protein
MPERISNILKIWTRLLGLKFIQSANRGYDALPDLALNLYCG